MSHATNKKRSPFKIFKIAVGKLAVYETTQRRFIATYAQLIAANLDLDQIGIPVVNHRDGKFLVVDGQHRVWAIRNRFDDLVEIECEVHDNLTDEQMADLFLGRDARRAITAFDKFRIAIVASHVRECAIQRVVEAANIHFKRSKSDDAISCVTTLCRLYEDSPMRETAIGWAVRVARDGFPGDPLAFDGPVIEALGRIHNRYNGKVVEKLLAERLRETKGVRGLMSRAEIIRARMKNEKWMCLASVFVDVYNTRAPRGSRLDNWWREKDRERQRKTKRATRARGVIAPSHAI